MFLTVSTIFAIVFGAIIGSFLNVVIHRVPIGESVVHPGSRCPTCRNDISWYDNIPVASWLILGGQCRNCKAPFSGRYAAVEGLMGFLSGALWIKLTLPLLNGGGTHWSMLDFSQLLIPFFMYFAFVSLCISIAFIDLEHFIIPHGLSLPGIVLGLASPWVIGYLFSGREIMQMWPPITPGVSMTGAIVGALSIISIFLIYLVLRGVAGMGGGDVTLMAMMGAWLGWPALLFIFFAASIQGLIAAGLTTALGINFVKDASEVLNDEELADQEQDDKEKPLEQDDEEPVEDTDLDSPQVEAAGRASEDEGAGAKPHGEQDNEQDDEDEEEGMGAAIPFGPFIVLAGLEHFYLGPFLPDTISMIYMYLY